MKIGDTGLGFIPNRLLEWVFNRAKPFTRMHKNWPDLLENKEKCSYKDIYSNNIEKLSNISHYMKEQVKT